ncbi:conjugal transfer protein TraD [Pseudostreptobacillus hongkongensis]|uniref:conjugal transfer protein TraD n=1 Tax=Pseudostreptobacillus hongkongensis TaxID=1162717 RepID=UPI00082F1DEE|nr:conjugal transfer protein TraD [Pseudostreptobacillus hongkongensis]
MKRLEKVRTRKERASHLIKLGIIFELLGIDEEDHEVLLGFLLSYLSIKADEKEKYKKMGILFKEKRIDILRNRNKGEINNE